MTAITPAEQAEIDLGVKLSDELFDGMLEVSKAEDCDAVWVAYSLFLSLVQFLTIVGWTTAELQRDVAMHSERDGGTVH